MEASLTSQRKAQAKRVAQARKVVHQRKAAAHAGVPLRVVPVNRLLRAAQRQYEYKAHTRDVGASRSPKQMTKAAKKEQKKALKKIKTTIQKTGSRLKMPLIYIQSLTQ